MNPRITLSAALCLGTATMNAGAGLVSPIGDQQLTHMELGTGSFGVSVVGGDELASFAVLVRGPHASLDAACGLHLQYFSSAVPSGPTPSPIDLVGLAIIETGPGSGFADMDWSLDAVGGTDGLVAFEPSSGPGRESPLGVGFNRLAFGVSGRNPLNVDRAADLHSPLTLLRAPGGAQSTDWAQVTVDVVSVVPLPNSAVMGLVSLAGVGGLLVARKHKMRLL